MIETTFKQSKILIVDDEKANVRFFWRSFSDGLATKTFTARRIRDRCAHYSVKSSPTSCFGPFHAAH
jgi:hypothetical protein